MGAWWFISPRFETVQSKSKNKNNLIYIGRRPSAAPATGYPQVHKHEHDEIMEKAFH